MVIGFYYDLRRRSQKSLTLEKGRIHSVIPKHYIVGRLADGGEKVPRPAKGHMTVRSRHPSSPSKHRNASAYIACAVLYAKRCKALSLSVTFCTLGKMNAQWSITVSRRAVCELWPAACGHSFRLSGCRRQCAVCVLLARRSPVRDPEIKREATVFSRRSEMEEYPYGEIGLAMLHM